MTDDAKRLIERIDTPEIFCGHCSFYCEPNGCNRLGGECKARFYTHKAAYLIERLSTELEQVKRERKLMAEQVNHPMHYNKP